MTVEMTTEELKRLAESIMPGPWKITDTWGNGTLDICPDYPHPSGGEWADIAQVNDLGDTYDDASQYPDTPVLAQANARAIALLPDLLHELIEWRETEAGMRALLLAGCDLLSIEAEGLRDGISINGVMCHDPEDQATVEAIREIEDWIASVKATLYPAAPEAEGGKHER